MFGNSTNHLAHMVEKHQWEKIEKKLSKAGTEEKAALAAACGSSTDDEAIMLLVNLLQDDDDKVLLQAVKSLGEVGIDSSKMHLQWLLNHLPDDKKELRQAIDEATAKISKRS